MAGVIWKAMTALRCRSSLAHNLHTYRMMNTWHGPLLLASTLALGFACTPPSSTGGEGEGEAASEGEGEEGEGEEGEGEGDVGGEGEGEGESPTAAAIRIYCEKVRECDPTQGVALCIRANEDALELVATVDNPVCNAVVPAYEAFYACVGTLTCAQVADPADPTCATQAVAVNELNEQGATSCFQGEQPVATPAAWICSPAFFSDGDCDCGCGAVDAACEGEGTAVPGEGPGVAGCDYCYDTTGEPLASCDEADGL